MRNVQLVVLDFDGTVADTMPYLVDLAAGILMDRYGMTQDEARRAYIETTGLPFVQQMEIIFPGDARNGEAVGLFEALKRENMGRFGLFPDVAGTVSGLRNMGIKVCLSSGSYKDLIDDFLYRQGLTVDLAMGYRPGFEKGRDHFGYAMQRFRLGPEVTVFVGDSIKDGERARDSGIRFIGKAGLVDAGEFRRRFPEAPVIASLGEILHIIQRHEPPGPATKTDPSYREGGQPPSG